MKVLILGGDGTLGHQLLRTLSSRHETRVTLRGSHEHYRHAKLFDRTNAIFNIDASSMERLFEAVAAFRPDAIVNAVGIVKQRGAAKEAIASIEINSLLPHRVALLASAVGARFIHVSTDCVFSGARGPYTEADSPDPVDLYGRSKLLGEVVDKPHALTLRTSIVGRELSRRQGLLEWFLAQKGTARGFSKAIFSGLTTNELSRVIETALTQHPKLNGLYHVSGDPIDKNALLQLFARSLNPSCAIEPDESFTIDRSLVSTAFRTATGYRPPSWPEMVAELEADTDFYLHFSKQGN